MVPCYYQRERETESIAVGQLLSTAAAVNLNVDFADLAVNQVKEIKALT